MRREWRGSSSEAGCSRAAAPLGCCGLSEAVSTAEKPEPVVPSLKSEGKLFVGFAGFCEIGIKGPVALSASVTMLFVVRFVEDESHGTSISGLSARLAQPFPGGTAATDPVQLCTQGPLACIAQAPGRPLFHVDALRLRNGTGISEPWCQADAGENSSIDGGCAALIAKLQENILMQKIKAGDASAEDQISLNLAKRVCKRRKAKDSEDSSKPKREKSKKKKDASSGDSVSSLFCGRLPWECTDKPSVTRAVWTPGALCARASMKRQERTEVAQRKQQPSPGQAISGSSASARFWRQGTPQASPSQ